MASTTIANLEFDFEDVLTSAEARAKGMWEEEFVEGLRTKFTDYGERMFLSERQAETLLRIAGEE